MTESSPAKSPAWGSTTKLVVGLTMVAVAVGLLIHFKTLIGPLLFVFILAYLLHPAAAFLSSRLHLSWRLAVTLIYLFIIIIMLGLLTLGGVGLIQQIQSLIQTIEGFIAGLPDFVQRISVQVYQFGPFKLDMRTLDLNSISQQLLSFVQPLLGRTGELLSGIASGAAEVVGWGFFVLLVSYFFLAEATGPRGQLFQINVPGYGEDVQRLRNELSRIWNAFLRGQLIIFAITAAIYLVVLSVFGVSYAIGLAFMAGLAKFLPYVGAFIVWSVVGLVSYFQTYKLLGWQPATYALIVVVAAIMIDQTVDNMVSPRIMARSLKVHPAAVLVAALIAADFLGLLGVMIAAPILATMQLLGRYAFRKMFDMNPWPTEPEPPAPTGVDMLTRFKLFRQSLFRRKAN